MRDRITWVLCLIVLVLMLTFMRPDHSVHGPSAGPTITTDDVVLHNALTGKGLTLWP